jgi:hypothetical protein
MDWTARYAFEFELNGLKEEPRAKLLVREPGMDVVTVFLTRPVTVLGRDQSCDAFLHSPYVSRRHAQVVLAGDEHVLSDLDSTNGTSVNGNRVEGQITLVHGDEIGLSNVRIWYMLDVAADEQTPLLPDRTMPKSPRQPLLLSLDPGTHRIWIEERSCEVPLAPLEFKLVEYLMEKKGQVATRDEIGLAVWGASDLEYESLYRLVDRVKEKIEPEPSHPRFLISHRGIGYSLQTTRPRSLSHPD